jgi:hypothetical protein
MSLMRDLDMAESVRQSDLMETTLTNFQRNFRVARAAADRGETVTVQSGPVSYVFLRTEDRPQRPFADLEPLFGAVRLTRKNKPHRETIRQRLKARRSH